MGVLNTQDREKRDRLFANLLPGGDDSDTYSDDDTNGSLQTRQRTTHSPCKSSRAPRPQSYIKNTGRRARGCKNSRKYENSIFLSDLIESDEFDDLNITDFMVKSVSAFEMLFEDEAQMSKWSEFVSMKEEEQEKYLRELTCVSVGKCSSKSTNQSISVNDHDSDLQNAAKCFQNIDNRIKTTLKNRNISMDGLTFFEEEVLSFFVHVDEAVLVSLIPSSMDRLLVHGICQYMKLTSSSYPRHVIQVENQRNQFRPPAMPLSQYLQRITR